MTASAFAKGKGFAEGTLRWWAWKLGGKPAARAVEPIAMLRVVRSAEASASAAHARRGTGIEIEIGGARVSVGAGADRVALRDVLDVLGALERERGR